MPSDALLLVGREGGRTRATMETHARRLVERGAVDAGHVATYDVEPARELREQLAAIDADRVYAVPTAVAHTPDTLRELPGLVADVDAEVTYCEPLGRSPRLTDLLVERAAAAVPPREDASLLLVGLGGSTPHARQVVDYHAARIAERDAYGQVRTCYLVQNPAAECARYDLTGDRAVAVPVFLADCEATRERIPERLELDRGGLEYAAPMGEHRLVTDALEAEVAKQRALRADAGGPVSFEDALVSDAGRLAADGQGARSGR